MKDLGLNSVYIVCFIRFYDAKIHKKRGDNRYLLLKTQFFRPMVLNLPITWGSDYKKVVTMQGVAYGRPEHPQLCGQS